ncbi:tetratricopeptide repeat protein, partial [Patescibacteria group bacterium]|nr:tetratricopeptide repeat protein [Patescibacteria group bacterium]
ETHRFIIPMGLFVIALLLLFLATPLRLNLPAEVTPSLKATWAITTSTLSDTSALFGSGPGTFIYDYAKYHSVDVNATQFWNVRFDRGSNHFLTMLASFGVLGVLLWVLFVAMLGAQVLGRLVKEKDHTKWKLSFALFAPWAMLVFASFLYSSNFTLTFLLFVFAALLGTQAMRKVSDKTVSESPRLGLLFSFLFVLVAVVVVSVLFVTGQRYAAEVSFAKAVKLDVGGGDLTEIVQKLDRAATLNRYNDIYYRNLSQALLMRVSEELNAEGEMTQDRADLIRALTAASINAAKRSTDLGPANVLNWKVRGAIYREVIAFIGGADQFAKESFEKATELEPVSPENYTELGRVYIVIAETQRQLTGSTDQETADAATAAVEENLKAAEDALNKAIELKADYAPAHYQLAIVFERQGRLDEAVSKMESVALYNRYDVGVFFQLGLLYLRQGDNEQAQAALEYTVNLVPSYSNARWFLASIYELNGDVNRAIEQVEKVLELNPDNELVKTRLDKLKSGVTSEEIPQPVEAGEQTATDTSEGTVVAEPAEEGVTTE